MIDYPSLIKQTVTMPQILDQYGLPTARGRRIPCPIHHGEKKNFAYKNNGFVCYVCNAHGDVISFVMQYFGLDFMDACRKIDADFRLGLNVGGEIDQSKREEAERICAERKEKKRLRDAERKRLVDAYHTALDRWIELDRAISELAPQTPFDDFTEQYADALKHIDVASTALDEAECALSTFEHAS